jgi:hypothetical protein
MEVQRILKKSYQRTKYLLTKNKHLLTKLAKKLVEKEVMDANDVRLLLNIKKWKLPIKFSIYLHFSYYLNIILNNFKNSKIDFFQKMWVNFKHIKHFLK